LNSAFSNPRTISLAYLEAALLVEHLVATYGDAGVQKLVRAYGQGLDDDEALKSALGTSFTQLQPGFDAKLAKDFGSLLEVLEAPKGDLLRMAPDEVRMLAKANPRSYPVQLEQAAALVPVETGVDSPRMQIADLALELNDRPRAIRVLEELMAVDFDNIAAARQLASMYREAKVTDARKLRPVYDLIVSVDPFDGAAQSMVGRLALDRGDAPVAIRAFQMVLALRPVDRAAAHTDLAESYLRGGQRAEARKQTLAALEIAPSYERAQDLLLKLAEARP
jgi:tetratricopeptide (TPR) repeat protein